MFIPDEKEEKEENGVRLVPQMKYRQFSPRKEKEQKRHKTGGKREGKNKRKGLEGRFAICPERRTTPASASAGVRTVTTSPREGT
jgi:hypothetical protein